jgi:signal transduction histidine kinase
VAEREVLMRYSATGLGDSGDILIRVEDLVDADSEEEVFRNTERLISLGELSARVAHEIRNPLTGVRTTVQFVASKLRAGDSRRDDLQDVLKELDRIEQIITDLLLFARPQAGRPGPTDLREIAEKVLDNLARRLKDASIEVERDLDEDLPEVTVDPDMAQQVVLNLVINAIQAMPEGGTLKVVAGLRRTRYKKAYVDVVVVDSGPGIPDEVKEKIFDPFFTTRSMGTGLGLSISLQIAREHGGNLTARNLAQGGAAFKLSLPALLTPEIEEAREEK